MDSEGKIDDSFVSIALQRPLHNCEREPGMQDVIASARQNSDEDQHNVSNAILITQMNHFMGSAFPNECVIFLRYMPEETLVALFDALAVSPRLTSVDFSTGIQVSLGGCRDAFVSMVANSNSITDAARS